MRHPLGTIALSLIVGLSKLSAQATPAKRQIHFTVTDSGNRFVTGLQPEHFQIFENGVRREITGFADASSPLSIAIVSDQPIAAAEALGPGDELIQASSLADAVRQLTAARNSIKVLLTNFDEPINASRIRIVRVPQPRLLKALVELRSQYTLEFDSAAPEVPVRIAVNQPRGLPMLKVNPNFDLK